MKLSEKENLFQAIFVIAIVVLKRFYGSVLGEYENILFVFTAAIGLFLINWLLKRLDKKSVELDMWEDKWDLATILVYGLALLLLKWLHVTNIWVMVVVGVLIIGVNVVVKLKRREIKKNMDAR